MVYVIFPSTNPGHAQEIFGFIDVVADILHQLVISGNHVVRIRRTNRLDQAEGFVVIVN